MINHSYSYDADNSHNCPECGSIEIVNDDVRGEKICTICGLVVGEYELVRGRRGTLESGQRFRRITLEPPRHYSFHPCLLCGSNSIVKKDKEYQRVYVCYQCKIKSHSFTKSSINCFCPFCGSTALVVTQRFHSNQKKLACYQCKNTFTVL
ncbi:MAG: TFIIB-type zinc ribbon-containing protein [Candidatus Hodarchaeota archaeon]